MRVHGAIQGAMPKYVQFQPSPEDTWMNVNHQNPKEFPPSSFIDQITGFFIKKIDIFINISH